MKLIIVYLFILPINGQFMDYIKNIGNIFNFEKDQTELQDNEFNQKIPYEVSLADEKFIQEAAKLTGVALSDLDSCQQRVVLKLKKDCHNMNDEDLAKMGVHLLNCQSHVEGRKLFPCNEGMTIKQCTSDMDSDTWTSYHLMTNRARAVCYSIRQSQFRGLAEHTVNRLMDATQNQLVTLEKIEHNQEKVREIAEATYEALNEGHDVLKRQQQDLQKAQLHEMLTLEDNIQKIINEKKMIAETHNYLIELTTEIKKGLQESTKELEQQAGDNRQNHEKLIQDITAMQKKFQQIFNKIEESSNLLVQQRNELTRQYQSTLKNLNELNNTVHNLGKLVGSTRQALEERFNWLAEALGGTDKALDRLYHIIRHLAFILLSMLVCAFLSVETNTRYIVIMAPILNLIAALIGEDCLDVVYLGPTIILCVLLQRSMNFLLRKTEIRGALQWNKNKLTSKKTEEPDSFTEKNSLNVTYSETLKHKHINNYSSQRYNIYQRESEEREYNNEDEGENDNEEERDTFNSFVNPTPPLSHIGSRSRSRSNTPSVSGRNLCNAITRTGTPCKLSVIYGRDYCFRHQKGSSVIM